MQVTQTFDLGVVGSVVTRYVLHVIVIERAADLTTPNRRCGGAKWDQMNIKLTYHVRSHLHVECGE